MGVTLSWKATVSGSISFDIGFSWNGTGFSFSGSLSLQDIANALSNLWPSLVSFMQNNVRQVFASILGSLSSYISAIKNGLFSFAGSLIDLGHALISLFAASALQVAQAFYDLGKGFEETVRVIVNLFSLSFSAATAIVAQVFGSDCPISSAKSLLFGDSRLVIHSDRFILPPSLLIDLRATPAGNRFLTHYYDHQSRLRVGLDDPQVRTDLRRDLVHAYREKTDETEWHLAFVAALNRRLTDPDEDLHAAIEGLCPRATMLVESRP